jgi:hypothetical protein
VFARPGADRAPAKLARAKWSTQHGNGVAHHRQATYLVTGHVMGESRTPRQQHGEVANWRKASRCQGGECVEVLQYDDVVMVRESGHAGEVLRVAAGPWRDFTDAVRAGEFDHLD